MVTPRDDDRKMSSLLLLLRKWVPALSIIALVIVVNVNHYNRNGSLKNLVRPGSFLSNAGFASFFESSASSSSSSSVDNHTHLEDSVATLSSSSWGADPFSEEQKQQLNEHEAGQEIVFGNMMVYTRARHRHLEETAQATDKSKDFTTFGKVSTSLIYFAFWAFLMFPNMFLPIGRPGIALVGGLSMVVWRFILFSSGNGPYFNAEHVIIMDPLFLLFGLMLTTIYISKMEQGGLFDKLRDTLDNPVNWIRVAKILGLATIGAAAIMNDSIVLIFSSVVVDLCVRDKVENSLPYLLSLATAANIGSALTMTGNPQNILIVSLAYDHIGWIEFASNMVLPVIAATAINAVMIFVYYSSEIFPGSSGPAESLRIVFLGHRTSAMIKQEREYYEQHGPVCSAADEDGGGSWSVWSRIQVGVVVAFLVFFAFGFNVCVVSIAAGAILMIVAAYKRKHHDPLPADEEQAYENEDTTCGRSSISTRATEATRRESTSEEFHTLIDKAPYSAKVYGTEDPEDGTRAITGSQSGNTATTETTALTEESETTLTELDYGLLMLFIGQFTLIGAFDDTGVPQAFFNFMMGDCDVSLTDGACVYWFVSIVAILSNIASNVPVCQMLAATFPFATPYQWLQVSFSATIAGNFSMMGSAANMIVAFQAAKAGDRTFTSERHAPFGIPSTLLCLYAGTFLLATYHFSPDCSVKRGDCDVPPPPPTQP